MQLDQKRLLIFGGINRRIRYDDVWVLNVADKKWEQPKIEGPCPAARAHHTATKCGNKILVFGGYAGNGRALGDLWILHLSEDCVPLRWEEALLSGAPPTPRFDHCAFIFPVTPNSSTFDKYMVMGGRDNSSQFSDSYMLDLNKMAWESDAKPPALTYELCNNLCDDIESVPYHKVFTFGGKRGATDFQNVVEVMDCGMQFWHQPEVQGTPPCPRYLQTANCSHVAGINSFLSKTTPMCHLRLLKVQEPADILLVAKLGCDRTLRGHDP